MSGRIKNNVFTNQIHTLEKLEAAIVREVQSITEDELQRVFNCMKRRIDVCLENEGGHIEHLL